MTKEHFNYDLPEDRIAHEPLPERDQSLLLQYKDGAVSDHLFTALPELLPQNSQLIFNNTRVVKARLHFTKTEGAKPIEIFCLGPHKQSVEEAMRAVGAVAFECLIGNLKRWKDHPLHLRLANSITLEAVRGERDGNYFVVHFSWNGTQTFAEVLAEAGKIPLPPYMNREAGAQDVARYQTVYAASEGSVAAPTAGLHFTERILQSLKARGNDRLELTLHVGAGTFKPLDDGDIDAHEMHSEELLLTTAWLEQYLKHQGPKFAVGTTSLRTLESTYWMGVRLLEGGTLGNLGQRDAYELPQHYSVGKAYGAVLEELERLEVSVLPVGTRLMIKPGYRVHTIAGLITNFHQPGSTLLLLVSACIGERWREVYRHALEGEYRFLSYGDSSLLYLDEAK
jgi:S-adenosylmethionine:tRNA ribosyltransferase-isomerase